jgi:malate dehydrogenase (oxaloacetate-decarboxylating)
MKLAAARAIASVVGEELDPEYIIPSPFNRTVVEVVAPAVARAAQESGVARKAPPTPST